MSNTVEQQLLEELRRLNQTLLSFTERLVTLEGLKAGERLEKLEKARYYLLGGLLATAVQAGGMQAVLKVFQVLK